MARIFSCELRRFRISVFSHPAATVPQNSGYPIHSYSSSSTSCSDSISDETFFVYNRLLKLLKQCQRVTHLYQIQAQLITSGIFQIQYPSFATRVLKVSADLCGIDHTLLIFRTINFPDTFCVNTMINAYACSSVAHHAVIFYFERLKNGFFPSSFTFPPLFSSCAKMACLTSGTKCQGQVIKRGVDGVLQVQNSLIYLYSSCGLMDIAERMFVGMTTTDLVSWNTLLGGFAGNGDLGIACKLFDNMPHRNIISWNILITGHLDGGNPGCSLKLFREMVKIGLPGNHTTMVCLLTACGRSARLKEGRSIHGSLIKSFVNLCLMLGTSLIDMYGKCGRADIAQTIFDRMPVRNLICWNAMLLGHCIHGNPIDGLNLYAEMLGTSTSDHEDADCGKPVEANEKRTILPDEITFVGLLCACTREGLLTEGRKYFREMIDVFHLRPNFAHYWCMANLLAKLDLRQAAMEILRILPDDKDISSLATLLGSCRFHGDVYLGEQLAKHLIEQDSQNFLYYVLLLNVYAVAGQWDKVAQVRELVCEKKLKRMPGSSLADLKEMVHGLKVAQSWQETMQKLSMTYGGYTHLGKLVDIHS